MTNKRQVTNDLKKNLTKALRDSNHHSNVALSYRIILSFCLSLQSLELPGLRLQPRSNSATGKLSGDLYSKSVYHICSSFLHAYLCYVLFWRGVSPIELICT